MIGPTSGGFGERFVERMLEARGADASRGHAHQHRFQSCPRSVACRGDRCGPGLGALRFRVVQAGGRAMHFADAPGDALTRHFASLVWDAAGRSLGVLRIFYNATVVQQLTTQALHASPSTRGVLLDEHHIRLADSARPDLIFTSVAPIQIDLIRRLRAEWRLPEGGPAVATGPPALEAALERYRTAAISRHRCRRDRRIRRQSPTPSVPRDCATGLGLWSSPSPNRCSSCPSIACLGEGSSWHCDRPSRLALRGRRAAGHAASALSINKKFATDSRQS